jgi:hypothetical protein
MINQKLVQPNNPAALQTKVITRDTKHNSFDTGLYVFIYVIIEKRY